VQTNLIYLQIIFSYNLNLPGPLIPPLDEKINPSKRKNEMGIGKQQLKKFIGKEYGTVEFKGEDASINYWGPFTANFVRGLIEYPSVVSLSLSFEKQEPGEEQIEALKILLRQYRETLVSLSFTQDNSVKTTKRDPLNILSRCLDELNDLKALDLFTSRHLYIDNQILKAILNPKFTFLRIEPDPSINVDRGIIEHFKQCTQLCGVVIKSKTFLEDEARKLEAIFPDINISVNGLVKWE